MRSLTTSRAQQQLQVWQQERLLSRKLFPLPTIINYILSTQWILSNCCQHIHLLLFLNFCCYKRKRESGSRIPSTKMPRRGTIRCKSLTKSSIDSYVVSCTQKYHASLNYQVKVSPESLTFYSYLSSSLLSKTWLICLIAWMLHFSLHARSPSRAERWTSNHSLFATCKF